MDRRVTPPKWVTSPTWRPPPPPPPHLLVNRPLVGHEPREGEKYSQAVEEGGEDC